MCTPIRVIRKCVHVLFTICVCVCSGNRFGNKREIIFWKKRVYFFFFIGRLLPLGRCLVATQPAASSPCRLLLCARTYFLYVFVNYRVCRLFFGWKGGRSVRIRTSGGRTVARRTSRTDSKRARTGGGERHRKPRAAHNGPRDVYLLDPPTNIVSAASRLRYEIF